VWELSGVSSGEPQLRDTHSDFFFPKSSIHSCTTLRNVSFSAFYFFDLVRPPAYMTKEEKCKLRYDWKSEPEEHMHMHMHGPLLPCKSSSPLVAGLEFPRSNLERWWSESKSNVDSEERRKKKGRKRTGGHDWKV
jgi:hypothetical protein